MSIRILILTEDEALREDSTLPLSAEGCEVLAPANVEAAIEQLDDAGFAAVAVDRRLCASGGPLLSRIARHLPEATLLLLGDSGDLAEEAVRRGAYDVLRVPLRLPEVRLVLRRVAEREALRRQRRLFQRDVLRLGDDRPIVASSPAMIRLLETMERAAEYKSPVLLSGESGSGLEVLARAIHAQSARRNRPFVAVQCAGRSEEWLDTELLGSASGDASDPERSGAGLLFEAHGGSLYLGEVGALPLPLQRALLGVLRDEPIQPRSGVKPVSVDVRVITSTARDLHSEVAAERFEADLCSALDAVRLAVPPLRFRPTDIPLLVDHFLARARERYGKPALQLADDALDRLVHYDWPGNIRELELVLERAVMLAAGDRLTQRDLPDGLISRAQADSPDTPGSFGLRAARKSLESDMIRQALRATHGNRTHAARLLEISHRALLYKVKEYGIRD